MCRSIHTLYNVEPAANAEEARAAALQFVRKVSGYGKPSRENEEAFDRAVNEVAEAASRLVSSLHTHAPPRDRETEAIKEALDETNRRRAVQLAYNEEHGIEPQTILKGVSDIAELLQLESPTVPSSRRRRGQSKVEGMSRDELEKLVVTLEEEMYVAADELRFEYAAKLRDEIKELRRDLEATASA